MHHKLNVQYWKCWPRHRIDDPRVRSNNNINFHAVLLDLATVGKLGDQNCDLNTFLLLRSSSKQLTLHFSLARDIIVHIYPLLRHNIYGTYPNSVLWMD